MDTLGERIRYYRKSKKLNQEQLAKRISHQKSVISRYENNEQVPPLDILKELCDIFKISLDELAGQNAADKLSLYNLSDEQSEILKGLADMFRQQNESVHKTLTEEQYAMLGRITAQFFNSNK